MVFHLLGLSEYAIGGGCLTVVFFDFAHIHVNMSTERQRPRKDVDWTNHIWMSTYYAEDYVNIEYNVYIIL